MISESCFVFQRKFCRNHSDGIVFCRELEDVDDVPEPKVSKKGQIEVKEEPITPLKSATPTSATTRLTRASERSALQGIFNR